MSQLQIIQNTIATKRLLANKATASQRFKYLAEIEKLKELELEISLKSK